MIEAPPPCFGSRHLTTYPLATTFIPGSYCILTYRSLLPLTTTTSEPIPDCTGEQLKIGIKPHADADLLPLRPHCLLHLFTSSFFLYSHFSTILTTTLPIARPQLLLFANAVHHSPRRYHATACSRHHATTTPFSRVYQHQRLHLEQHLDRQSSQNVARKCCCSCQWSGGCIGRWKRCKKCIPIIP